MKTSLLISILISSFFYAQNYDTADQLADKMCVNYRENKNLSDSARIQILNEKFIFSYLNSFPEEKREEKADNLYIRFQKVCQDFREYLYKIDPPKQDSWIRLSEVAKVEITDREIREFRKIKNFHYLEYEGERTKVRTDGKFWIETFEDGTFSRLSYQWLDHNKFELVFLDSNNYGRKNFSTKGDRYQYEIIKKENNDYWIQVKSRDESELLMFKLSKDQ